MKERLPDPRHFNADPNPAFHLNEDPDHTLHFNADQDPAPRHSGANLRPLVNSTNPPRLHCERPRPFIAPFLSLKSSLFFT